jgi:hypothetical protein
MKIRKSRPPRVRASSCGRTSETALSFSAPTGFLIADHRSGKFCFMQENVGKKLEARPRRRVRFRAPMQSHFNALKRDWPPEFAAAQATAQPERREQFV